MDQLDLLREQVEVVEEYSQEAKKGGESALGSV